MMSTRFVTFDHEKLMMTNDDNKNCHILSQITTLWHTLTQIVTKCQFSDLKLTQKQDTQKFNTQKNFSDKKCHVRKILMSKNVTYEKFYCHFYARIVILKSLFWNRN